MKIQLVTMFVGASCAFFGTSISVAMGGDVSPLQQCIAGVTCLAIALIVYKS